MKGGAKINHLVHTGTCRNEFRTIGCGLDGSLFLGVPANGHLVKKVKNASDRMASDNVMVDIGIKVMGESNILAR